jgi:4-hydroxybenzoate polyprenyltransferase
MLFLQAAIGTANDLLDEPADRRHKPGKPLPRGLISRTAARALLGGALTAGLVLSALSGPIVLGVAVAGVSTGLAYDRWFKGTAWSWLPFTIGIPLLPVYAWLGATGGLPAAFVVLVAAAMAAGGALAIANQAADMERDLAAGVTSAATLLGERGAWRATVALHGVVLAIAAGSLAAIGGRGAGIALAVTGGVLLLAGLAIAHGGGPKRREQAWEVEALGIGVLATGWVAGASAAGAL